MHFQVQYIKLTQFHFSSGTWSVPFSAISCTLFGGSLYRSWSAPLHGIPTVSSSAHQTHLSFFRCTLFTRYTNKFTLTFIFSIGEILHPFAPLRPFLRALSSVSHILSHLHLGELLDTFLCSSKQIIDCTLKRTIIYTKLCIIYSAGIALYACGK